MTHPATKRAVREAVTAIGVPLDIGFVFPPKHGEVRGFGQWTDRDLSPTDVMAMMPRAAAANARGGHVYMRLGPSARHAHPGILMLDDLDSNSVERLAVDGLEPCLVIETSNGNRQAWLKLVEGRVVPHALLHATLQHLVSRYDGDPKAMSTRQPGRLPGFTNRKPKHRRPDGHFPFVRLLHADPTCIAKSGRHLLEQIAANGTARAGRRGAPQTPRAAADPPAPVDREVAGLLDFVHREQEARIALEVAEGRRPPHAASASEVDFATVRAASRKGVSWQDISIWLARRRPEKDRSYPERTVHAVQRLVNGGTF